MVEDPGQNKEEQDYYWENGLMVFTRNYHLKRGYCCQSGCRHCPYGFKKENEGPDEKKGSDSGQR